MDLKTRGIAPTPAEVAAVDTVLGAAPPDRTHDAAGGRRARRHLLLPTLHALNDRVGWISMEAIDHVAERLDVSPAEIHGVATFYGLFSTVPRTHRQLHVCVDLACRAHPSFEEAALPGGAHPAPCLGLCAQAPAAMVVDPGDPPVREVHVGITASELAALANGASLTRPDHHEIPQAGQPGLVLLRRAGRMDPLDLDAYLANGGLEALHRARELGPTGIIDAVDASGLVGRGGAAFPTARKWEAVRTRPETPHHLVCNADESEPGTYKDRVLVEHDPFALLESMYIAAIATGSEHGWIYVRGEYPRAESTLAAACDVFRSIGVLGDEFDITLVRGAGAYICGEETALFNSIEGFRGEPRNKPPFPFESGLFGRPTVVNNVETLMNVPSIVLGRTSTARRLFCVSGAVAVPGVYEVELGLTLGELIDVAGGLRSGSELAAVLLGGAAGRFVGPDATDLVLDHDSVREAGLTLGSGAVIVHDQHVDLVDQIRRVAAFFREESCGQCVPCRVGTVRQQEALDRLASGGDPDVEVALVQEIGRAMTDASICGLGQTASHAIESAMVALDLFGAHRTREAR